MMNNTNKLMQDVKVGQIYVDGKGVERRVKAINNRDVILICWKYEQWALLTRWSHDEFLLQHTLKEEA